MCLTRHSHSMSCAKPSKLEPASPEFLDSDDGVRLACRRYIPPKPRATVLFYHGGGAHSGLGYQHLGNGLQTQFNIAVYSPDIRGHGRINRLFIYLCYYIIDFSI